MYTVACPSCGANVNFRSAASVMAVCEYCQSTLVKDADAVKDIGKMSSVLEDYSPIQITTSGEYKGKPFSVVGRIQLKYDGGFWNEWYLWFDDGSCGWLSDASGQYIITLAVPAPPKVPAFESIKPGLTLNSGGLTYMASDVRSADCIAGQGELPFAVGPGWVAKVADFRFADQFLTLDYSDEKPELYQGSATNLNDLKCQLLRSPEQIVEAAGKYRGKTAALSCPGCGSSINYQAGLATQVVCPSCHAEVECSTGVAVALQKHTELEQISTTLNLGDKATIESIKWRVIGLMQCCVPDDDEEDPWFEYLLFNEKLGFLWLIETSEGWEKVNVLNEWPECRSSSGATFQGSSYTKLFAYHSQVIYAAGAFNWRVSIGDTTHIIDYSADGKKLTRETSSTEITWSAATKCSSEEVAAWFAGTSSAAAIAETAHEQAENSEESSLKGLASKFSGVLLLIQLPLLLFSRHSSFIALLVTFVILWAPVWIPVLMSMQNGDDD